MATIRFSSQLLRKKSLGQGQLLATRSIHARQAGTVFNRLRPVLIGGSVLGGAFGIYTAVKRNLFYNIQGNPLAAVVHAAAALPESQPSVFSQGKRHALYLTIHLSPKADPKACAKAVANLEKSVVVVCPKDLRDEENEVWAGVGFGPSFYSKIAGKTKQPYTYVHRKGPLGEMPSTGGDIFIHAKSNDVGILFHLCQQILKSMPAGSVERFEDVYSFVYRNGRDLSGFIDGTENPADDEHRQQVAVEPSTGGSYVITQKWIHNLDLIGTAKDAELEGFVGRSREDSTELKNKHPSSHVARMTGGTALGQKKVFEIVRQSMPYGNVSSQSGLFFIAYAASPKNFDYMLDRMTGAHDGLSDNIMQVTRCVAGNYWYFPGVQELKKLV